MAAAQNIVARLVGQQDPQNRQRERPAASQCRRMVPDPMQGKEIALAGQRWLAQAKVPHEQGPGTRRGEDADNEQAERHPGDRANRRWSRIRVLSSPGAKGR